MERYIMLCVGLACTALFIWMLYRAMLAIAVQGERYQSWVKRDEELDRKFHAALLAGDYEECERCRYQLKKNLEAWREFKE